MSSQRNRNRGPNRNSEAGGHGEEVSIWDSIQRALPEALNSFNDSSANVRDIQTQEKLMAEKQAKGALTMKDYNELDNLFRKGVKANDLAQQTLPALVEQLKVLRAVQKSKEQEQEQTTSSRGGQRSKDSGAGGSASVYDFDGPGDSPVPSPNPAVSRRMGGAAAKGDRDSVPPSKDRATPTVNKAGSVEPQTSAAAAAVRTKQNFAKGDEVAFKPKPATNEQTDWILGIVQEVRGEGKSRRYKVLDADAADDGTQKEFRTSASSMILIPKEGTVLQPLETGKVVLALYPQTTTFYKAEVMGMASDGKVNLRFEGEESSNTMQSVNRRHVVEYRG